MSQAKTNSLAAWLAFWGAVIAAIATIIAAAINSSSHKEISTPSVTPSYAEKKIVPSVRDTKPTNVEPVLTSPTAKPTGTAEIETFTQQTPVHEASSKQLSRFARGLTDEQRKALQATLSNIYILTCTYHLDRDTINSHEVAQAMDDRAHDAFNQTLHSKAFEPLTSDIDGLSKYKALEGELAVYELQLSIVLERSISPGDSPAEWLNESIGFAKDQRIKLKNALDAICDYSDIPKFDNP